MASRLQRGVGSSLCACGGAAKQLLESYRVIQQFFLSFHGMVWSGVISLFFIAVALARRVVHTVFIADGFFLSSCLRDAWFE